MQQTVDNCVFDLPQVHEQSDVKRDFTFRVGAFFQQPSSISLLEVGGRAAVCLESVEISSCERHEAKQVSIVAERLSITTLFNT